MKAGDRVKGFVSFVDFAATVLNLAGIDIPDQMDGKPFMGKNVNANELNRRDQTYGYADRMDEKYDMVRSYRKGNFKYIRCYHPFQFDGLMNNYRNKMLASQEWLDLYKKGELNELQSRFFKSRNPEMLFDLKNDPLETRDLSGDHAYSEILHDMRNELQSWEKNMPDISFYPEFVLVAEAFDQPVEFGISHINEIVSYIDIANLQLIDFQDARPSILSNLGSDDPWARYWALIVCSSFGEPDRELVQVARELCLTDPELINRVRAAEFLGLIGLDDPEETMISALYASEDPTEALLILNTIVLMQDGEHQYHFDIDPEEINEKVANTEQVERRLSYLIRE